MAKIKRPDSGVWSDDIGKAKARSSAKNNSGKGKEKRKSKTDFELSSPSSYKETSPECEIVDIKPCEFHRSKSARAFIEQETVIENSSDNVQNHRNRLITPSCRSMDNIHPRHNVKRRKSEPRRRATPAMGIQSKKLAKSESKKSKDDPFSEEVDKVLSPLAKDTISTNKNDEEDDSPWNSSFDSGSEEGEKYCASVIVDTNCNREPARVTFREFSSGIIISLQNW
jgi:hypothetical protein